MNSLIKQIAVAVALVAPVASFAQSNQPVTRDQVRADLVRVEQAGYNPLDRIHYPDNIQAAEQRVKAQQGIAQADTSGYGPSVEGASQAGSPLKDGAVSSYSPNVYQRN
ncbi:DUF4148 domain-containing protein [Trinickia soli]|uniref:DUF4148 domain-containing protein n=1 Tax=Trinickia soli TaxID=380675 RepID=A0A2N7WEE5_9BURK|nr:DUF4148 domain-containing protein [Trinickia soli]PMS27753.1 hypothetical protein C0Z19_03575 [Trinickia soli]CAB3657627.1 hypothetical protein LMG24076_01275 [Trinickia soli]